MHLNTPYKFRILVSCSATEFSNVATAMITLAVFIDAMTQDLNWSRTVISLPPTIGAILGALLAPVSGQINDRIGSKYLIMITTAIVAICCVVMSFVQIGIIIAVALTVMRMVDQGGTKVFTASTVTKTFVANKGMAVSIVFFAGSIGCMLLVPVISYVINEFGWRQAWFGLGVLMFCGGTLVTFVCVPFRNRQESFETGQENSLKFDRDGLKKARKSLSFVLVFSSLFLTGIATAGTILHVVSYLGDKGFSNNVSVTAMSLVAFSSAVGSILWGRLGDKYNTKLITIMTYLSLIVAILFVIFPFNNWVVYCMGLAFGLAGVGINTLSAILLADYYGRNILASIYGLSRTAQVLGFAIGTQFSALVYDLTGAYEFAFITFLIICTLGLGLLVIARKPI